MNEKKTKPEWEDYGESSLTLLAVIVGINKKKTPIPYDPSDFKRCIHLFECLCLEQNEIFDLLNETANKYPEWRIFTDNWDTLMDLYEEEKGQDFAPKLYELMLSLIKSNEVNGLPPTSKDVGIRPTIL